MQKKGELIPNVYIYSFLEKYGFESDEMIKDELTVLLGTVRIL